jgi:serine/threonine protein kinase/tetratricopeptide (TPR) repeat protein
MTTARTRRDEIDAVLDEALDHETGERAAWLDERCGDDAELRREVAALLAAHARAGGILDQQLPPLARALAGRVSGPMPVVEDRRIGPYRVLRELGRGGMGVVYLAERSDGEFRRQVAIKLLRASPDAEELHRRFLAERQILASLNHPNIAQLLDGGTTEGQLPYLVMEHVDGLPITTYCDRHGLDVAARLRLFTSVCDAVQAAHQNLVIHRDLKPSNILVTESGDVKLLDFGIAKLLNGASALVDVPHTRAAMRVMTPEYASPEQVRGEPLSTASDVYALGVILYELLTGVRPYQLRTGTPRELHEMVCEREPERPSSAVTRRQSVDVDEGGTREVEPSAIAATRGGTTAERLARQLRGDVDAIVMMALRKEPRRRYGSAELLSEDITRFLQGLPVTAQRASRRYHLAKFLGRHRVVVGLGALAVVSMVGGTAAALHQTSVARRERARAEEARSRVERALLDAEEMSTFLVNLFDINGPMVGGPTGSLADAVARGDGQVAMFDRQPLVQARMLDEMGRVRTALNQLPEARSALERSLTLRRANGASADEIAGSLHHLSEVLRRSGEYDQALALDLEALARRRAALGPGHVRVADVLEHRSGIAVYRTDLIAAESLSHAAVAIRERAPVRDPRRLAYGLDIYANMLKRRGKIAEAMQRYRQAIAIYERELDPDDPWLASTLLRLAELERNDRDRPDLARPLIERSLRILTNRFGEDHPAIVWPMHDLAEVLGIEGRHAEAERLCLRALELRRKQFGPTHGTTIGSLAELAQAYLRAGRLADAERRQREAVALQAERYGTTSPYTGSGQVGLAQILIAGNRLDEADSLLRVAYETYVRYHVSERGSTPYVIQTMGAAAAKRGDVTRADSLYRRAITLYEGDGREATREVRRTLKSLAELHRSRGDDALAARYQARADAMLVR